MSKYIDADSFIEENDGAENSGWTLKELINNFPPADVRENVYSEWEYVDYYNDFLEIKQAIIRCKKCGYEDAPLEDWLPKMNYCPYCGAWMRKKVEE